MALVVGVLAKLDSGELGRVERHLLDGMKWFVQLFQGYDVEEVGLVLVL